MMLAARPVYELARHDTIESRLRARIGDLGAYVLVDFVGWNFLVALENQKNVRVR